MKKLLFAAALLLVACTTKESVETGNQNDSINVTFCITPDPWQYTTDPMRTRALDADGKAMTDIWVLDYDSDGNIQQQLHQSSTDDDFGRPTLTLAVGAHHIYFVASRGQGGSLDTDTHTLTFTKVSDTFYKDLALNVQATTNGSQAVTLGRCVTKLRLTLEDAIPATAATFNITPASWYYTIDYTTGEPAAATSSQTIAINIPAANIGQTGLDVSIFSFSGTDEWSTDVTFNCKDSDDNTLGAVTVTAPMKRNRVSTFAGPLFSSNSPLVLSLNTDWSTEYTGTW